MNSPPRLSIDAMVLRFPARLWKIVNSSKSGALSWGPSGKSIRILRRKFETEYLSAGVSKPFKTSKYDSFVRQLNHYGFKKITNPIILGESKEEVATLAEYYNPLFSRDHPEHVAFLHRRCRKQSTSEDEKPKRKYKKVARQLSKKEKAVKTGCSAVITQPLLASDINVSIFRELSKTGPGTDNFPNPQFLDQMMSDKENNAKNGEFFDVQESHQSNLFENESKALPSRCIMALLSSVPSTNASLAVWSVASPACQHSQETSPDQVGHDAKRLCSFKNCSAEVPSTQTANPLANFSCARLLVGNGMVGTCTESDLCKLDIRASHHLNIPYSHYPESNITEPLNHLWKQIPLKQVFTMEAFMASVKETACVKDSELVESTVIANTSDTVHFVQACTPQSFSGPTVELMLNQDSVTSPCTNSRQGDNSVDLEKYITKSNIFNALDPDQNTVPKPAQPISISPTLPTTDEWVPALPCDSIMVESTQFKDTQQTKPVQSAHLMQGLTASPATNTAPALIITPYSSVEETILIDTLIDTACTISGHQEEAACSAPGHHIDTACSVSGHHVRTLSSKKCQSKIKTESQKMIKDIIMPNSLKNKNFIATTNSPNAEYSVYHDESNSTWESQNQNLKAPFFCHTALHNENAETCLTSNNMKSLQLFPCQNIINITSECQTCKVSRSCIETLSVSSDTTEPQPSVATVCFKSDTAVSASQFDTGLPSNNFESTAMEQHLESVEEKISTCNVFPRNQPSACNPFLKTIAFSESKLMNTTNVSTSNCASLGNRIMYLSNSHTMSQLSDCVPTPHSHFSHNCLPQVLMKNKSENSKTEIHSSHYLNANTQKQSTSAFLSNISTCSLTTKTVNVSESSLPISTLLATSTECQTKINTPDSVFIQQQSQVTPVYKTESFNHVGNVATDELMNDGFKNVNDMDTADALTQLSSTDEISCLMTSDKLESSSNYLPMYAIHNSGQTVTDMLTNTENINTQNKTSDDLYLNTSNSSLMKDDAKQGMDNQDLIQLSGPGLQELLCAVLQTSGIVTANGLPQDLQSNNLALVLQKNGQGELTGYVMLEQHSQ